jgi:hypothetical protein
VFKFLTRPGCHLCDEARPLVKSLLGRGESLLEIDIDTDDDLTKEFGLRIPVLVGPDGSVIAEGIIEGTALRRSLRRYRRGS